MASSAATPVSMKASAAAKPSRKARIIAKIRSFTESESSKGWSKPCISVHKPSGESSESFAISFPDQPSRCRESYEVDYCYEQDEDNAVIFPREIKPLISGVFEGHNASVVACGARGSGKTCTILGCDEYSGLAAMTMNEILMKAGKERKLVKLSLYEVYQDHVYDILDPKKGKVLVLENGKGKIQLKGLSEVPVNSISEFHQLCNKVLRSQNLAHALPIEASRRSHRGLMVHVSSLFENLNAGHVGKMNFVDVAGYEDLKRKSGDELNFVESSRINRSIYALHNVVNALNANENHVPYRESKLTRILQDSFGGTGRILVITCLNPTFCQDTISMVNLAWPFTASRKKAKSSTNSVSLSSSLKGKSPSASVFAKNQSFSRQFFIKNKDNGTTPPIIGRKLKRKTNHCADSKEGEVLLAKTISSLSADSLTLEEVPEVLTTPGEVLLEKSISSLSVDSLALEEVPEVSTTPHLTEHSSGVKMVLEVSTTPHLTKHSSRVKMETCSDVVESYVPTKALELSTTPHLIEHSSGVKMETCTDVVEYSVPTKETCSASIVVELSVPTMEVSSCSKHDLLEDTPRMNSGTKRLNIFEVHEGDKENVISRANEDMSPPISARLRDISNRLKNLCAATPLSIKLPIENGCASNFQACTDVAEPKTPVRGQTLRINEQTGRADMNNSPWGTFSIRSSGMKNSLIKDYMKFLNSASKEELKKVKGIGERRAACILELRELSPEPFKNLDDLKEIGLSGKQVKGMMKQVAEGLFS